MLHYHRHHFAMTFMVCTMFNKWWKRWSLTITDKQVRLDRHIKDSHSELTQPGSIALRDIFTQMMNSKDSIFTVGDNIMFENHQKRRENCQQHRHGANTLSGVWQREGFWFFW